MWIPAIDLSILVMNSEKQHLSFLLGSPTFLLVVPVHRVTELQSHRMVWVGRDFYRSCSSKPPAMGRDTFQ